MLEIVKSGNAEELREIVKQYNGCFKKKGKRKK